MSDEPNLVLREYEISKESIRWVMGQLVTVAGTFIAISVVIFRLVFDGDTHPIEQTTALTIMIIILVNLAFAFVCYQNVQVTALQRHIHSLEIRLQEKDIFRWESRIARIWYGNKFLPVAFNFLVAFPALALVITLYASLGYAAHFPNWFWYMVATNSLYLAALVFCFVLIARRIVNEIPIHNFD